MPICGLPDCALCYSNRKGRSNHKGHWGYRVHTQKNGEAMARFAKREEAAKTDRPSGEPTQDAAFARKFPAIWEFLTLETWEDGKARLTSTLLFLVEGGRWKACLNDRALDRSCWAAGDTVDACMASLEASMSAGTAEWRRRAPQKSPRKT